MSQYDAASDYRIWRYDVTGYSGAGELTQCGVDIRVPGNRQPNAHEREPALIVLHDHIKHFGVRPISGVLKIPDGLQGRFL